MQIFKNLFILHLLLLVNTIHMYIVNNFSLSMACIFIFLMLSFDKQNVLIINNNYQVSKMAEE